MPPGLPDLKPEPVTSWPTLSSLVHLTVPPTGTLTVAGLNLMLFIDTSAVLAVAPPPALAGAFSEVFAPPPPPPSPLSLPPPQPEATNPSARTAQSGARNLVMCEDLLGRIRANTSEPRATRAELFARGGDSLPG